ncbi:MAG: 6-carboxytetrahydropterin synthase [Nitrospira sp.]|nr:6-carboxytetrahydropterin synthase [Candidatus Manganitrophaceae bacterium]HIL35284.1 6-carboxytetrahydropterin synthase [Candidatus Manganitrophaceae bacterium]
MYKVTRTIEFCYGHRLLNYKGKCRHLHGHNARVEIELYAEDLDALGMVRDFEVIKKVVQVWIDENLDHKMILCKDDPLIPVLKDLKESHFIIDQNPTAEVISKLIYDYAASQKLPVSEVRLWETPKSYATYRR